MGYDSNEARQPLQLQNEILCSSSKTASPSPKMISTFAVEVQMNLIQQE